MDHEDYVRVISEIFDGYTAIKWRDGEICLRHLNLRDQRDLNVLYKKFHSYAIEHGIEDESEILKRLKDEGEWTDKDDLTISEKRDFIEGLKKTKSKIPFPSQQTQIQQEIDKESVELFLLQNKRASLIGSTANGFATSRSNEEFLRNLLFNDKNFSKHTFSDEEFGALEHDDIVYLNTEYTKMMRRMDDQIIQEAVLQDCFSLYLSFCEKPFDFLGLPLTRLSVFQLKMLVYGRMFHGILTNVEKIPEEIKKDPKALIDYASADRNKEKFKPRGKTAGGNTAVFGSKEDAENFDRGAKVMNLSEQLKKNGGQLSMEDMVKAMGHEV